MLHPHGFPDIVDNTMRSAYVACEMLAKYEHIDCLVPNVPHWDIVAGHAWAVGVEAARKAYYIDGASEALAIRIGQDALTADWGDYQPPASFYNYKTLDRLIPGLQYYFSQWPLDDPSYQPYILNNEKQIEANHLFELPINHPVTAKPLLYSVRFDLLADPGDDLAVLVDEKLTKKISDEWALKFDMDSQVTGYIWAAKQLLQRKMIRMDMRGTYVSKNDFGHATIPIYRPQWQLDRWYAQMVADFRRFKDAWETAITCGPTTWNMNLGDVCTAFNRPCDFLKLCMSQNPERLIASNYKEIPWNPVTRER